MNPCIKTVLLGAAAALGLALSPAMGQHDHAGHEHGDHDKGHAPTGAPSLPNCPVSGEPVNLAVSLETVDGPVFFCCKGCIPKYEADPATYAEKAATQRKALAERPKVQVRCPVSREPVDPKVSIESGEQKVYFCCEGCISKYEKEPEKYASALANSYTYQTKCPVMGEDINPKTFTRTASGASIFYCCKGCDKKFFQDPQKYAPNLVAQGYRFDPAEMKHEPEGDDLKGQHGEHGQDHDHGDHDH